MTGAKLGWALGLKEGEHRVVNRLFGWVEPKGKGGVGGKEGRMEDVGLARGLSPRRGN